MRKKLANLACTYLSGKEPDATGKYKQLNEWDWGIILPILAWSAGGEAAGLLAPWQVIGHPPRVGRSAVSQGACRRETGRSIADIKACQIRHGIIESINAVTFSNDSRFSIISIKIST